MLLRYRRQESVRRKRTFRACRVSLSNFIATLTNTTTAVVLLVLIKLILLQQLVLKHVYFSKTKSSFTAVFSYLLE